MLASQQITDTIHQIQIAKKVLSNNPFIEKPVSHNPNKATLHSLLINYHKNQCSDILKSSYRHNSCKSILQKTDIKTNSSSKSSSFQEEPKPKPYRYQKKTFVSNSTQIPSDLKIIVYLNNNNNNNNNLNSNINNNNNNNLNININNNKNSNNNSHKGSSTSMPNKRYEASTIASKNQMNSHDKEKANESRSYSVYSSYILEEYSYKEDQNVCFKESMEDKGKSVDAFNSNKDNALFCLFDGHGGDSVSLFLQKNYPYFFKKSLEKYKGNVEEALRLSFRTIDNELKGLEYVKMGSTGCVVYITKERGNIVVYCANIGDTRASLIKPAANEYKRLSYDHRADDPKEKKRIIHQGGMVLNGRVMGQLMLSRAFGDFELKGFGVKCEPYITRTVIPSNDNNQFLFIASDGVWDVMNEREIQHFLSYTFDTETLVDKIISRCIAKKAWDNLSVFAIKLC